MSSIFFFIPFFLIVSIGIYQQSFAVETIIGEDYFDVKNLDGSHTWSSHEPYVSDGNQWVPFIQNGNEVITAHGNILINTDGSFTWADKGITDTIIAKYADVSNLNSWTYPNTLNNGTPDISWNGTALISSKVKAGVGQLDYKYVSIGSSWKTQLEATNLSALTTKAFGFDEIFDINKDTLKFGNQTVNLDNYNNTTFGKQWIDNHESKVIDLLNGINYDFDIAFDSLYSITVYDTGVNSSRLVFDYRTATPLLPGQTLILDPTFTSAVPSSEGRVYTNDIALGTCGTTYQAGDGTLNVKRPSTIAVDNCQVVYFNFDVSGIAFSSITVQSATIEYDITNSGSPVNCDWKHLAFTGGNNNATLQALVFDTVNATDILQNDATCTTGVADGYVDTFDTGGYASLIAGDVSGDDIVSLGIFFTDPNRDGTNRNITFRNSDAILSITYLPPPPYAVTDLTNSTTPTSSTITLDWTEPYAGGGGQQIIGYQINMTTPQTSSPLVFVNDTGNTYTNYNFTGLFFDTDYSVRVAPWTNVTSDHPLTNATGNVFNFTTAAGATYSSLAPTSLIVYNHNSSPSILDLEWVAPLMDNINGYRIAREAPVGGGFSTIVGNTTNSNAYYNNTGLSVNTYYNYKVYALNGTGITGASNTYSLTTYHLPDAVDDLSADASDLLSIVLSWTQPTTLYGYLLGYQINYTTPQSSDPVTVITENTGSSDVEYEIVGLSESEGYSFRVAAVTIHGKNVTGANVANATAFNSFTVGSISITPSTNDIELPISFAVHEIDSDTSDVVVTYDSSYELACDFDYAILGANTTYTGLTENAISGTEVYSNFTVNGINNDIIDIHCWDVLDDTTTGDTRIGQSNVPMFDQVTDFQDGLFGTTGKFGSLDLMTLIIVIISMIAFNRTHPYVGIIVMFAMMAVMGYYGLVQPVTIASGLIILIVALAIAYGRREQEID